ncbi:MAG TPA: acyl-CoA reductase, partial [Ramlibacter sp.]|nr:acyl-CoA reductase [Ramlibacter sp.]
MTTRRVVAGYLPGLAAEEVQWQTLGFGSGADCLDVAVPVLSPAQMKALALRVKQASAAHLKTLAVSQIIDIIDRSIARLLDPAD